MTVGGQPAIVRKSVEEGLEMLDQLEKFAAVQAAPEWQEEFGRAILQARDLLKQKL